MVNVISKILFGYYNKQTFSNIVCLITYFSGEFDRHWHIWVFFNPYPKLAVSEFPLH